MGGKGEERGVGGRGEVRVGKGEGRERGEVRGE